MTSIYDIIEQQDSSAADEAPAVEEDETEQPSRESPPSSPLITPDEIGFDPELDFMDGVNLLAIIARFI